MSPAAIARATIAPLLARPTLRAEQVSQLVLGETADVLAAEGEWRRVRTHLDGYEGWMHAGYAIEVGADEAEVWRSEAEGWSLGAAVNLGDAALRLPLRARVMVDGDTVRLPDGRRGRLTVGEIPVGAKAITAALNTPAERWAADHFPGSPYQWGGVTRGERTALGLCRPPSRPAACCSRAMRRSRWRAASMFRPMPLVPAISSSSGAMPLNESPTSHSPVRAVR